MTTGARNRIRAERLAFTATVRKEWQVMRRYWPDTTLLLAESALVPIAYWAQAAGFAGGDPDSSAAFARRAGTSSVAGFVYLGWVVYMWILTTVWGPGSSLRKERLAGSLEYLLLTPVSRLALLFGPATAQLLPATLLFSVTGAMMRFAFGVPLGVGQIATGVVVVLASIPVLFGLAGLVGVSVLRLRDAGGVNAGIQGLIPIVCGVVYPLAVLPEWIRPISGALPVTRVADALRAAVLARAGFGEVWIRALYLLAAGVLLGVAALLLLRLTLANVRRTGRLGQF